MAFEVIGVRQCANYPYCTLANQYVYLSDRAAAALKMLESFHSFETKDHLQMILKQLLLVLYVFNLSRKLINNKHYGGHLHVRAQTGNWHAEQARRLTVGA